MPDLDQVFAPSRPQTPDAFGGAQVFEAIVSRRRPRGLYVVIPGYDRLLEWGPCLPEGSVGEKGDRVVVAMSDRGRPWLIGQLNGEGGRAGTRTVWAIVSTEGSLGGGDGIDVASAELGVYGLAFTPAFSAPPAVAVTTRDMQRMVCVTNLSADGCVVVIANTPGGASIATGFSVIATGLPG